ncbi:MAG: ABC transporter substrate-binding protein [Deltaproteobacteria bacterium]|nr:ABC transporter substrate-binding protein [Deltaproteobacteria bacterium]
MKHAAGILLAISIASMTGCATPSPENASAERAIPRRIVSQLPSLTETCFALGLGDRVVGVTDYCLYPAEARARTHIGGLHNPKFETVVSLRPDIVLLQDKQENFVAKYEALGIRAMTFSTDTVADVIASIAKLGRLLGRETQATDLIARINAEFDGLKTQTSDDVPVPALVIIGHDPGTLQGLYAAAKGSFHDELLVAAGGVNVVNDNGSLYPPITKDTIVERSPEVILELVNEGELSPIQIDDRVRLWDALPTVSAVRNGRVRIVVGDQLLIPGPRMAQAAAQIHHALHMAPSEKRP